MTIRHRISCFAVVLVVAGCSTSGGAGATRGTPSVAPTIVTPTAVPRESILGVVPAASGGESDATGSGSPADRLAAQIARVVVDAAGRGGVTPDQVKVVSVESRTYPDGSLDCPQPGMAYTQMVVDGYKIVVEANGITYDYRGTANGFRLCSQTPS